MHLGFIARAGQVATEVADHLHRILAQDGTTKTGGYFSICDDMPSAQLLLMARIGTVPLDKYPRLPIVLWNDMQQLIRYPERRTSWGIRKRTAWASGTRKCCRHPQETEPWGIWGGTIRVNGNLYGAQGWTEAGSEALSAVVAMVMGELRQGDLLLDDIGERNKYLRPLMEAMRL